MAAEAPNEGGALCVQSSGFNGSRRSHQLCSNQLAKHSKRRGRPESDPIVHSDDTLIVVDLNFPTEDQQCKGRHDGRIPEKDFGCLNLLKVDQPPVFALLLEPEVG